MIAFKVRGHVTQDIHVVESVIGEDSSDVTGFSMTSDKTKCLNPKVSPFRWLLRITDHDMHTTRFNLTKVQLPNSPSKRIFIFRYYIIPC